jgi:hypothetical protein
VFVSVQVDSDDAPLGTPCGDFHNVVFSPADGTPWARPRYSAAVAFDPAGPTLPGSDLLRTPTMVHVGDYGLAGPIPPRDTKPTADPGSKYTYFDALRDAGVDTMQVSPRASTHIDWGRPSGGPFSTYGEMVAVYYTLAWFDRYLKGVDDVAMADDALRRLTATDTFDGSADVHSIGTGFFDAQRALSGGSVEAGNVPITIEDMPIRNRLSFYYPTRYSLKNGTGQLQCEDVRAGCQ